MNSPTGWHVPSMDEFTTLINYLIDNGYGFEGSGDDIASSLASTSGWYIPLYAPPPGSPCADQANNNSSGFSAFPAGRLKTKTFFLICLLSGICLTQLNAQSNDKNINRSYAYWCEFPMGGMFPVSCDGVDVEWLEYDTNLHVVAHVQDGVFQWQIFEANWEAKSQQDRRNF